VKLLIRESINIPWVYYWGGVLLAEEVSSEDSEGVKRGCEFPAA
jgi:hypothetical protein